MPTKLTSLAFVVCFVARAHLGVCQFDDYNVNDLDEYQIYEGGYDALEEDAIANTYFDPYVGDYDDPYADTGLDDIIEIKDCQIAADGSATFNGVQQALAQPAE